MSDMPVEVYAPGQVINWSAGGAGLEVWNEENDGGTELIYNEQPLLWECSPETIASFGFWGEAFEKWLTVMVSEGHMSEEDESSFLDVDEWGVGAGVGGDVSY